VLHGRRHPLHGDPAQSGMDLGFIALLFLVAASGLVLWGGRATAAMPLLLCGHLGAVLALFVTLPYGRFAHGAYRAAALLRYAVERRLPSPVGPAAD
jgi:citrate/tricarballylate utilization protein